MSSYVVFIDLQIYKKDFFQDFIWFFLVEEANKPISER